MQWKKVSRQWSSMAAKNPVGKSLMGSLPWMDQADWQHLNPLINLQPKKTANHTLCVLKKCSKKQTQICMKNSPNHHHHQNQPWIWLSPRSTYQFKRIFTREKHINHQKGMQSRISKMWAILKKQYGFYNKETKKKRRERIYIVRYLRDISTKWIVDLIWVLIWTQTNHKNIYETNGNIWKLTNICY